MQTNQELPVSVEIFDDNLSVYSREIRPTGEMLVVCKLM